jgi:hypothetical protein
LPIEALPFFLKTTDYFKTRQPNFGTVIKLKRKLHSLSESEDLSSGAKTDAKNGSSLI